MTKPLLCGFLQVMSGLKPSVLMPAHGCRHALSPIYIFPALPAHSPARTCVCIYIVCLPPPFCFPLKNHALQPVCQSVIYEKVLIFLIKKALYIWCVFPNPLLLHPLSRTGAAIVWHSDRNGVGTLPFFLLFGAVCFMSGAFKKKNEKKTSDLFGVYEIKFLPLHPLSKWEQRCLTIFLKSGR